MALTISYFDPGYGAGIDGVTCVENETYNPVNGVAFTKNNGVVAVFVPNPGTPSATTHFAKRVTARFSAYFDFRVSDSFMVGFGSATSMNNDKNYLYFNGSSHGHKLAGESATATDGNSLNGFHNISFSVLARTSNAIGSKHWLTYEIDDGVNHSWNRAWSNSSIANEVFTDYIVFKFSNSSGSLCYVSNVIITTEYVAGNDAESINLLMLSSNHFPVKLPLKDTSGDFISLGDGEYVGNSAGQKLLSVVDASDVITKFGGTSKVSHLVTYGHPGYRVGANITNATGISEENSSIAAHGSCSLSTDTDASAAVAWAVDNTRLSDVDGMKIGWQV